MIVITSCPVCDKEVRFLSRCYLFFRRDEVLCDEGHVVRLGSEVSYPGWTSISKELPPDEQFVLLRGPSGVVTTPEFVVLGRRYTKYRPPIHGNHRWLDVNNVDIKENGWTPSHWQKWSFTVPTKEQP